MPLEDPNRYDRIRPIPTLYRNIMFRSRLEARWALFFDQLGIIWQYEPRYFDIPGGYRPDFFFPQTGLYAEVKPEWPEPSEIEKAVRAARKFDVQIIFLDGMPRTANYWSVYRYSKNGFGNESTEYGYAVDGIPVQWTDYLFNRRYPTQEGRFYTCTGMPFGRNRPDNEYWDDQDAEQAADYARTYTFAQ